MLGVPADRAETTPAATVARAVLLLDQDPPVVTSARLKVLPVHTAPDPVIADGVALTVTIVVTCVQPGVE